MGTAYIANEEHYSSILIKALEAKRTLWIGTADIKDLHIKPGNRAIPFLQALAERIENGLEVRLIHAKEPGPRFREDFDRFPALAERLERMLCPRVHFKLIIIDCEQAYIGSANLTGAGLGMKSPKRRNFEAGILTDDLALVGQAMQQFDEVWIGTHCETCGRTDYCTTGLTQTDFSKVWKKQASRNAVTSKGWKSQTPQSRQRLETERS